MLILLPLTKLCWKRKILLQNSQVLQPILFYNVLETSQKFYDKSGKNTDNFANSLFQVEMKFDSLKGYVDSITSAVNQHATLINKLRMEFTNKQTEPNVYI